MRYPASEKLEIIQLVEQSHLPFKRTLDKLGIPRTTFYRWYDRYQTGGVEALEDRSPRPGRIWNRIPDDVRDKIVDLALEEPELSPRELAVKFTDTQSYFVSEASVYRLLKARDLITSPAFVVIKAADEFCDKTTAPNQMWQTDFTYLKVIGWGWFYLSTVLDDFSRYIIAWKLCTTMSAKDVTETLEAALAESGLDQVNVVHKPHLLSDNGPSYIAGHLADWMEGQGMRHIRGAPYHPQTQGKACPGLDPGSSVGIRRLRTAFYCKTIICLATWRRRSKTSSVTTITGDITKACKTSRPPTSTSGEAKPFYCKEKGLNEKRSNIGDCNIAKPLLKLKQQMSQTLR